MSNIRLFVGQSLVSGNNIVFSEKVSHYLCNVMRCRKSDMIKCFNPQNGEFACRLTEVGKKNTSALVLEQLRRPEAESNLWLLFAPLKKDKTDFVIEKAVELGAAKIIPVITRHTNSEKVKTERLQAQAVEAAEQCGRLSVPEIMPATDLKNILDNWNPDRILFFADERRQGRDALRLFADTAEKPAAVLIGPEGGFSDEESNRLNQCAFVRNTALGPRILRAETAALAALALWQAAAGDWKEGDIK